MTTQRTHFMAIIIVTIYLGRELAWKSVQIFVAANIQIVRKFNEFSSFSAAIEKKHHVKLFRVHKWCRLYHGTGKIIEMSSSVPQSGEKNGRIPKLPVFWCSLICSTHAVNCLLIII